MDIIDFEKLKEILYEYESCKDSNLYKIVSGGIENNKINYDGAYILNISNHISYFHRNHFVCYVRENDRDFYDLLKKLFKKISNNLDILEWPQQYATNFMNVCSDILCSKCFFEKYDNRLIQVPTQFFNKTIEENEYNKKMDQLQGDSIKKLVSMMKPGQKVLTIRTGEENYCDNLYLHLGDFSQVKFGCNLFHCSKKDLVILYTECDKCAYYYIKLLPYLNEVNEVNEVTIWLDDMNSYNIHCNSDMRHVDFLTHICKNDNLYKLLEFMNEEKSKFSMPIESIVASIIGNKTKNARTNLYTTGSSIFN